MIDHKDVRVVIAEDDYLVGEMIKGMLEEIGYNVVVVGEAADGLQAVELTQSLRPDVVLMDLRMPGMDGIEATRLISERCPTPVVALTAHETPATVRQASAAGAGTYLVKPSNAREIERAIAIARARFGDMMELRSYADLLEQRVQERTAQIQAQSARLEAILHGVGDAIGVIDLQMQIRYVNEAFTALTGYVAEEAIGQPVNFLVAQRMPEHDWQSLQIALTEGEAWQGEATLRRKDGRTYEAVVIITPVRDAEGHLVSHVSIHRDISQRKELERARRQFMTNVSHQLRTPVANMKLYAQLMQMGCRPEKMEHYIQVLVDQADRLAALIKDVLEMTSLVSGQAVMAWELVSLPTIIRDVVTLYQSQAEASGLTLAAMPVPPDLPTVKGDQARLTQALGELVENAVIFTPAGGQVTVKVRAVEKEGYWWVTIAVSDTGPGISLEERQRIFDRFYRGSLAESGHVPGTGLGLSIVQEIVRAHDGCIGVESLVGEGSTFTVWLPVRVVFGVRSSVKGEFRS